MRATLTQQQLQQQLAQQQQQQQAAAAGAASPNSVVNKKPQLVNTSQPQVNVKVNVCTELHNIPGTGPIIIFIS